MFRYMIIMLLLLTISCNDNSSESSSSIDGDQINFAAILNPPPLPELKQDMFEKTIEFQNRVQKYRVDRMQLFDESLAKFNLSGMDGDRRYQAGVVSLTDYDADKEIFYFEIKWQAKWVKQFFTDFPYEKQKQIKIAPEEAKALWNAGKEKPFFILVNRLDDRSIISNAIVRGEKKSWYIFNLKKEISDSLKDGSFAPEMVVIPAGSFRMGDIDKKPVHTSVEKFAMSKYEVTVGDFQKFVNVTGYKTDAEKQGTCYTYKDEKWSNYKGINWRNPNYYQNNNHPAVCISFNDAIAYAKWLSQQTGEVYRLSTEAEWEYAARAGTETSRYWGNDPDFACSYANVHDNISKQNNGLSSTPHNCTDGYVKTAPVGSFKANQFGLFDMLGNVWEWTCSEYEKIYNGKEKQCVKKSNSLVMRSSSWFDDPETVRSANRDGFSPTNSFDDSGFRLVRDLTL